MQHLEADLALAELLQLDHDGLQRALYIGLDDELQFVGLTGLHVGEQFF